MKASQVFIHAFIITSAICISGFLGNPAAASNVVVFAYSEGKAVHTKSTTEDGNICRNCKVFATDSKGRRIAEGVTNNDGRYTFNVTQRSAVKVTTESTTGNRGEYTIPEEEVEEIIPEKPIQPPKTPAPQPQPAKQPPAAPTAKPQPAAEPQTKTSEPTTEKSNSEKNAAEKKERPSRSKSTTVMIQRVGGSTDTEEIITESLVSGVDSRETKSQGHKETYDAGNSDEPAGNEYSPDPDEIDEAVDKAVEEKMEDMENMIRESQHRGPGFFAILGYFGYAACAAGAYLYLKSRPPKKL